MKGGNIKKTLQITDRSLPPFFNQQISNIEKTTNEKQKSATLRHAVRETTALAKLIF